MDDNYFLRFVNYLIRTLSSNRNSNTFNIINYSSCEPNEVFYKIIKSSKINICLNNSMNDDSISLNSNLSSNFIDDNLSNNHENQSICEKRHLLYFRDCLDIKNISENSSSNSSLNSYSFVMEFDDVLIKLKNRSKIKSILLIVRMKVKYFVWKSLFLK